ncbi:PhzF family phenazine biosynthesis protein [Lacibacterium aquatile]|uniref:PhzF family phenazine biosynthesis protein n=1 Tax=Lacibacterium aquatile TaxID=1168082 RepID=A0ABW5DT15_9PROT
MQVRLFQLDSFTRERFRGNPAAVMLLQDFPADSVMQSIADENNLAETAFLVPDGEDYRLRWFTPKVEVPLCGHATLAGAAVVMERLETGRRQVTFHTASGPLPVERTDSGYRMDFPTRAAKPVPPPPGLTTALGATPVEVYGNAFNLMVLLQDEAAVRSLVPDMEAIAALPYPGVIVTAQGSEPYDFVSRYFAPAKGIPEDPVTGGAHTMLAPFWAGRLEKSEFLAYQASRRGGEIRCTLVGDRVMLEGACIFYFDGTAEI